MISYFIRINSGQDCCFDSIYVQPEKQEDRETLHNISEDINTINVSGGVNTTGLVNQEDLEEFESNMNETFMKKGEMPDA